MTTPDDSDLAIAVDVSEKEAVWHLRLYVAGELPKSSNALDNLRSLCEEHLAGHYDIEVVDLVLNPALARRDDIVAVPTLVRRLPKPLRKIIGDLSNTERVMHHLRLADAIVATPTPGTFGAGSHDSVVEHDQRQYELTLLVGGVTDLSTAAIANAQRLCDDHMGDSYCLSVVDLHEEPASVVGEGVVVTPTLIKHWPRPVRKFVGDLSEPDKVLAALGLS